MPEVFNPTEDEIQRKIWSLRRRESHEPGYPGSNCDEAGFRQAALRELKRDYDEEQDIARIEKRGY